MTALDDHTWMLRAARGELWTEGALRQVALMRATPNLPAELAEALAEGDRAHPGDPRRFVAVEIGPGRVDVDAETTEAFDRIVGADAVAEAEAELLRKLQVDGGAEPLGERTNGTRPDSGPCHTALVDWSTFWDEERNDEDWLVEPLWANGRAHSMYAPRATGKSELALYVAANLALGRAVLGRPAGGSVHVVYLDLEMTENDLVDRLTDMGFAGVEFTHLHYYLLPALPPLDTPEGGRVVMEIVAQHDAKLVVIDTIGRVVQGKENENDTYLDLYEHTGMRLKRAGIAWVRLDHPGKDLAKGERGASAKGDDVDVVWEQTRGDGGGAKLRATKRRVNWVPELVNVQRTETRTGLTYTLTADTWPAGTAETAAHLDQVGAPLDISRRKAETLLRANELGARTAIVTAALKWRRQTSSETP